MLGERAQISATLKRDPNGSINIDGLKLTSGALTAGGQASLADNKLAADIKGALSDISLLSKDAKGAIAFALNAQGPAIAPDLSLTINSDRLLVAEREITGLRLTATGKADAANPAANVQLTGNVAGQALQGSAVLATADGKSAINGLLLSLGKNKISGDLALDDKFVPEGTISLDLPDIGPLAALALEKAEGDVRGTIAFSKNGAAPQVAIKAATGSITRGDLQAKAVSIDALIANYLAAPVISGKIRADTVTSGGTVISGIDVDLKRDGDWTGFSGGATVKGIPAKAAGRVKVANGTTTIELASGQATVQGIKAAIAQASTVSIANGTTTLDRLVLNLGGGTATVTGKVGQALDINATLAKVPMSLANSFSPGLDAAGSISGTVKVTGAPANPAVAFNIDAAGVQTSQTRGAGVGAAGVSSSGTFAGNKLTFNANVSDGAGLGLKGGGTVTTAGTPALVLDFNGAVPFGMLSQKLAAQGLALTGTANVNVQVRGPATSPVIGGSVSTSGARLVDARSGLAVNDLTADVSIGGGVARINRLTGTLSTRGSLSASGTVGINPAQGFPADLSIKLTDGRYTDGRVVTANLGGDLTIKGPLTSAPVIAGTVNLAKTVITVPDKLPGSLSALDVKHKNAPGAVKAQDYGAAAGDGQRQGRRQRGWGRCHGQRAEPDLHPGQGCRCRTRRLAQADRPGLVAASGRHLHLAARPAVDPRQAADLHRGHGRLLRLAGALPQPDRDNDNDQRHRHHRRVGRGDQSEIHLLFGARAARGRGVGATDLRPVYVEPVTAADRATGRGGRATGRRRRLDVAAGEPAQRHRRRRSRRHHRRPGRHGGLGRQVPERPHLCDHPEGRQARVGQGDHRPQCRARRQVARRGDRRRGGQGRYLLREGILRFWPSSR